MKLLNILHNSIIYEFRYLEQVKVIEVSKNERFTYLIKVDHSGTFNCNCPGAVFRHKCWHLEVVGELLKQETINEPWTEWTEPDNLLYIWPV